MNTYEIRERIVGAGDPKQAPISVVELTELLDIAESAFTPMPITGSLVDYIVVLTQYIAPEHEDHDNPTVYHAQKEVRLPFIPQRNTGLILPELGKYLQMVNSCHYDAGDGKFYATINAEWVQVWTGVDYTYYDYDKTHKALLARVEELKGFGWTIEEKEH
jgi:hypothetical protein